MLDVRIAIRLASTPSVPSSPYFTDEHYSEALHCLRNVELVASRPTVLSAWVLCVQLAVLHRLPTLEMEGSCTDSHSDRAGTLTRSCHCSSRRAKRHPPLVQPALGRCRPRHQLRTLPPCAISCLSLTRRHIVRQPFPPLTPRLLTLGGVNNEQHLLYCIHASSEQGRLSRPGARYFRDRDGLAEVG